MLFGDIRCSEVPVNGFLLYSLVSIIFCEVERGPHSETHGRVARFINLKRPVQERFFARRSRLSDNQKVIWPPAATDIAVSAAICSYVCR